MLDIKFRMVIFSLFCYPTSFLSPWFLMKNILSFELFFPFRQTIDFLLLFSRLLFFLYFSQVLSWCLSWCDFTIIWKTNIYFNFWNIIYDIQAFNKQKSLKFLHLTKKHKCITQPRFYHLFPSFFYS